MTDKLATVFETPDAAPEGLREFLVERDGKHVLNIDPNSHPEVAPLKSAYERVKGSERQHRETLKAWEALGLSPEDVTAAIAERDDLKQSGKTVDERVKQATEKSTAEIERLKASLASKDQEMDLLIRGGQIDQTLAKHGLPPRLARHLMMEQTQLQRGTDGKPELVIVDPKTKAARVKDHLGTPMTLDDLVAEMREDEELAALFPADLPSGSDAPPRSGAPRGNVVKIGKADAKDHRKYEAAKAQAEKLGVELVIGD